VTQGATHDDFETRYWLNTAHERKLLRPTRKQSPHPVEVNPSRA
jgi:hypothetical protein